MFRFPGKILLIASSLFLLSSFKSPVFTKNQPRNVLRTIIIDPGHGLPDAGAHGEYSTEADKALEIALKLGDLLRQNLPETKLVFTRTDRYLPQHLTDANAANRLRAKMANENNGDLFISIHLNSAAPRYNKQVVGHKKQTYYTYSGKGKSRKKIAHVKTVPIYKTTNLGCSAEGTEVYIWAVGKSDQKKDFVNSGSSEVGEGDDSDSTDFMFDSPEAKIRASILTKKYFNNSRMLATYVQDEFEKQGRVNRGVLQRNNKGIWVLQATAMPSILVETGYICNREEEDYLNDDKDQNEVAYAIMRGVLKYKESLENGNLPATPSAHDSATAAAN